MMIKLDPAGCEGVCGGLAGIHLTEEAGGNPSSLGMLLEVQFGSNSQFIGQENY